MNPTVLDYGRPAKRMWPRYAIYGLVVVLATLLSYAAWRGTAAVLETWKRYRFISEYQQAYAAVRHYSIQPGTTIMDVAAGPIEYMKPYKTSNGSGSVLTLVNPIDPVLERNLRQMRFFWAPALYAYASERQTNRGAAMITGTAEFLNSKDAVHFFVRQQKVVLGTFPMYHHQIDWDLSMSVHLKPSDRQTLPVILAGQSDSSPSAWTLPLTVRGKPEWVHFDHSVFPPKVSTSFGQITWNVSGCQITY